MAVQQDQPEDLLSFLAQVSLGTRISDQASELASYARRQQRDSLNYLEISVAASYKLIEENKPQRRGLYPLFNISVEVSRPSAVRSLQISLFPSHEHVAHYARQDLIYHLSSTFSGDDVEFPRQGQHKLKGTYNLMLGILLEPFITWDKRLKPYCETQLGGNYLSLEWPDIEVNSKMQWKLPLSRIPQQPLRDPKAESKDTTANFIEIPGSVGANPEKSTWNKIKKR